MKRLIKLISIMLSAIFMISMVGCGDIDLDDAEKDGTDIEISEPSYGFIERENFTPNKEEPLTGTFQYFSDPDEKFQVGTTYYLIIVFTVTPKKENSGKTKFTTSATFDNLDVLDATMQEASTSDTSVSVAHDMMEDKLTRKVQASFSIPSDPLDVRKYTMIVRMVPNKISPSGGVEIKINFTLDNSNYEIIGQKDGFSKTIDIGKGNLSAPVLSYNNAMRRLEWKAVKNASYYVVFDENDNKIKFEKDGGWSEKIYSNNSDDMYAMLTNSDIRDGYRTLRMKAYGENGELDDKFKSSPESNLVVLEW